MRVVNATGRFGLITSDGILDVATASGGRFDADIQRVFARWAEFREWAASGVEGKLAQPADGVDLGSPAPRPRQVFGIGLNYRDHAEEAGMDASETAMVCFTKFPASITGPNSTISLPRGSVDFEAELVVVIGREAYQVSRDDAWDYVAGLTVGQDLSERELQLRPPMPQFNLGKSFPGFAPMGPELVTPDEFADPNDLEIYCAVNGVQMQKSRTSDMIFPVAVIIEKLSEILPLYSGDVIFTGTPAGIGWARAPKVLLQSGDELTTTIESIGSMRNRFTDRPATP